MKTIIDKIKSLFIKKDMVYYYLIFMDKKPMVHFLEKRSLQDIYNLVNDAKMKKGTYKIIKGNVIHE